MRNENEFNQDNQQSTMKLETERMEEGHVDRSHDTLTLDISLSKTELTVEILRRLLPDRRNAC